MNLQQLKKAAREFLNMCEECVEEERELTVNGKGCSAFEARPAIKFLVDLIDSTTDEQLTGMKEYSRQATAALLESQRLTNQCNDPNAAPLGQ